MSLAFTPKASANKLKIEVVWNGYSDGNGYIFAGLFKTGTSNALCANVGTYTGDLYNKKQNIKFTFFMDAGTTSEIVFKVRAGSTTGTTYFSNDAVVGAVDFSSITITEIKV